MGRRQNAYVQKRIIISSECGIDQRPVFPESLVSFRILVRGKDVIWLTVIHTLMALSDFADLTVGPLTGLSVATMSRSSMRREQALTKARFRQT